jgi:prolyl oligopeptidase
MASIAWIPNRYPHSRRSDHVDVYTSESKGKVNVHDPYEWLEKSSEETDRWVSEQEQYTRDYLDACRDRVPLEVAIRKSTDYPKASLAFLFAFYLSYAPELVVAYP